MGELYGRPVTYTLEEIEKFIEDLKGNKSKHLIWQDQKGTFYNLYCGIVIKRSQEDLFTGKVFSGDYRSGGDKEFYSIGLEEVMKLIKEWCSWMIKEE